MHCIFHDVRLNGIPPAADFNLTVSSSDRLAGSLTRIRQYALNQAGPITMDIMCHGFETHSDTVGQRSVADGIGGGGLQLTGDNLKLNNVSAASELNGVVEKIVVYACSAAETAPGYSGSNRDGQRLFSELAGHTGAVVYAADATQWYWNTAINLGNASSSVIDFRRFEGNVYQFDPDGTITMVESNQLKAH